MMLQRKDIIRPGSFSIQVAADARRLEFDYKNEVIVSKDIPVDFVFIGDSITHFWELDAYFGGNWKMLINRGIAGDTTEYVLKRFEADVLQLKPQFTVLQIGVNDTFKIESNPWQKVLGMPCEKVQEEMISNIGRIMELVKKHRQQLILCSMLPTNVPFMQKSPERNNIIHHVNKELEGMAERAGIIFVNFHSGFAAEDGVTLMDGVSDDGVHPHVIGYDRMAGILKRSLSRYGIVI